MKVHWLPAEARITPEDAMADRLAELREIVTRDYEEARALIVRLGADTLARRTSNGWTVGQLAGHIATSPKGDLFVLGRLTSGKNASVPGALRFIIDVMNWWDVRKFKGMPKESLLQVAEDCHNERFARLNALSDQDLDRGGDVLSMGKLTAYEYMKRSGEHPREHAAEIKKTLGI
jgi:hypothetical protein